jgi:HAD superfamily hydrolase (TIGR01509 family)
MKEFLSENTYELKPGVKAFLEKSKDLPVRKVIVTSSRPEEKMPALESLGIRQYFDSFVSVKEVKRGKPFPDVYLLACRKLGLDPGECLAVEDSPNGVRSAYDAGVKVVMVPDLTGPTDELRRMCRVADGIEEVMEYLDN